MRNTDTKMLRKSCDRSPERTRGPSTGRCFWQGMLSLVLASFFMELFSGPLMGVSPHLPFQCLSPDLKSELPFLPSW